MPQMSKQRRDSVRVTSFGARGQHKAALPPGSKPTTGMRVLPPEAAPVGLGTNTQPISKADYDAGWWLNNAILHKMGLRKLGPEGCSWIDGDTDQPGWHYCGARRLRGTVYCEEHQRRSWTKAPKKELTE